MKDRVKTTLICIVIGVGLFTLLFGVIYLINPHLFENPISDITTERVGIITETEYQRAYTTTSMVKVGKVYHSMVNHHPAGWYVTVTCDGSKATFNNETFYKYAETREGETVKIQLRTRKYEDGEIIKKILNVTFTPVGDIPTTINN